MDRYVDDTTITATAKSTPEIKNILEENCALVSNWMVENRLKLNADKTHLLTLGTQERLRIPGNKVSVKMDGYQLVESEDRCEDLLGCKIEANLKWQKHIEELISKLRRRFSGLASF